VPRTKQSNGIPAVLKTATSAYAQLQPALKELRKKGFINKRTWKETVLPADHAIHTTLKELWDRFQDRPLSALPSQLLREDQVAEKLDVSRKTLYRRRKSKELPYIKDKHGTIWYAREDLEEYLEKSKVAPLTERPRKI
jgi:predicted DNA-binding transcriptional regulator AlpA